MLFKILFYLFTCRNYISKKNWMSKKNWVAFGSCVVVQIVKKCAGPPFRSLTPVYGPLAGYLTWSTGRFQKLSNYLETCDANREDYWPLSACFWAFERGPRACRRATAPTSFVSPSALWRLEGQNISRACSSRTRT